MISTRKKKLTVFQFFLFLFFFFLYFRTGLDFQSIRRNWESIEQYINSVKQHLNLMWNTSQLAGRCSLVDHDRERQGIRLTKIAIPHLKS